MRKWLDSQCERIVQDEIKSMGDNQFIWYLAHLRVLVYYLSFFMLFVLLVALLALVKSVHHV